MSGDHGATSVPPAKSSTALPPGCSTAFQRLYEEGTVPQFGCYKPLYLHASLASSAEAATCFFPPMASLLPSCTQKAEEAADDDGDEDAQIASASARLRHGWEVVSSVEELWSGEALQTKIPPAADYERMLLDRVWDSSTGAAN